MSNEQQTETTKREIIALDLVDRQTGKVLKRYPYASRVVARRRRDKLDLEYGACRYHLNLIFSEDVK